MATRGSALSRVRQYFKTADLDEIEVALQLISKDVAERRKEAGVTGKKRAPRTPRPKKGQEQTGTTGTGTAAPDSAADAKSHQSLANA